MGYENENFKRGRRVEGEQLALNGLKKNHVTVRQIDPKTGRQGATIPDAFKNEGNSTTEIKNVNTQTLTRQLRLQENFSTERGFKPELLINSGAQISKQLGNSAFVIKTYDNPASQRLENPSLSNVPKQAQINSEFKPG